MTGLKGLAVSAAVALSMVGLCSSEARAQESLTSVLSFLLTNQAVPTGDFAKDAEAARVTRDTLTRLLLLDLATVPISSSASGFVYRFDPTLGTMMRASDSFGPFFTERSLTAGRGQASFGASAQVARFTSLDGRDLRDGRLVTSANQFRDEPAPFDVEALTLELESRTVTFFANIGLTDWLDVGVAVPLVTLSLRGQRINTYRGQTLLQATATADATGLADAAVRAKYTWQGPQTEACRWSAKCASPPVAKRTCSAPAKRPGAASSLARFRVDARPCTATWGGAAAASSRRCSIAAPPRSKRRRA